MKNYIDCNVVMLPQNRIGWNPNTLLSGTKANKLFYTEGSTTVNGDWQAQHLYFTSQDDIKEGDWIINGNTWQSNFAVFQIKDEKQAIEYQVIREMMLVQSAKNPEKLGGLLTAKIVASTDPSLNLPTIPEEWIKKYVEVNGKITNVKLEAKLDLDNNPGYPNEILVHKITSNNEVIIFDEQIDLKEIANKFNNKVLFPKQIEAIKGKIIDKLEDAAKETIEFDEYLLNDPSITQEERELIIETHIKFKAHQQKIKG